MGSTKRKKNDKEDVREKWRRLWWCWMKTKKGDFFLNKLVYLREGNFDEHLIEQLLHFIYVGT